MGPDAPAIASSRPHRLGLGLLDRYLAGGVLGRFALLLAATTIALLLERALRLIRELSAAGADIGYLPPLLLQLAPYYLEMAVPLAFMAALVLLIGRLDERLELEAMLASGLSLGRIALPLVACGVALADLSLLAGGWLEPQGRYAYRALKIGAENAGRLGTLPPRVFFQPSADLVMTFDERTAEGAMRGIFVWQRLDDGGERVLSGGNGLAGVAVGERLFGVDFEGGRMVTGQAGRQPATLDFTQLRFRYPVRAHDATWPRGYDPKELTLSELVAEALGGTRGQPRQLVLTEISSRIARALMIPLLPLLVLPLAIATKKRGRTLGVLACVVVIALFRQALSLAKNFAEQGLASPPLLLFGTLAVFAAVVAVLFLSARTLPSHSPAHSVLDPVAARLARIEPKSGRVPGLRNRTLSTYLVWELGKWTAVALITLVLFLQSVDLIRQGDEFVRRGFGLAAVGRYALLQLPALAQQAMPMAALAGAMVAFALLGSRHEITAIRAAGLSQWRLLAKVLPVALLLSAATVALAEWATPASQSRLAAWWEKTEPGASGGAQQARWFRIWDEIVRAANASADGTALAGVEIYSRDRAGKVVRRTTASRASLEDDGWRLREVEVTRYDSRGFERRSMPALAWDVPLLREDVAAFFSNAPALSTAAAQRALAHAAPAAGGEWPLATRVQRAVAEPLGPLVMLLFALPIASAPARSGRSWLAMLYAGAGGMLYLVADGLLTVASQVGYVPLLLGAWAAPVVAALVAVNVLVFAER